MNFDQFVCLCNDQHNLDFTSRSSLVCLSGHFPFAAPLKFCPIIDYGLFVFIAE